MDLKYKWNIQQVHTMDVGKNKDVVVSVRWTLTGTDESGNEGVFEGRTPLKINEETKFIKLKDLTSDIIVSWLEEETKTYMNHIQEKIRQQIQMKTQVKNVVQWGETE